MERKINAPLPATFNSWADLYEWAKEHNACIQGEIKLVVDERNTELHRKNPFKEVTHQKTEHIFTADYIQHKLFEEVKKGKELQVIFSFDEIYTLKVALSEAFRSNHDASLMQKLDKLFDAVHEGKYGKREKEPFLAQSARL